MDNAPRNRWYDKDPRITKAVKLMEALPHDVQEELAVNLIQYIKVIRKNRKDIENPLSIGKSRVLGLYKASSKRRWYDKKSTLMSAMNILSTLPLEDCVNIAEAIIKIIETSEFSN